MFICLVTKTELIITNWTSKQLCNSWTLQEIAPFPKKVDTIKFDVAQITGICGYANFVIALWAFQTGLIEASIISLERVLYWLKSPLKVDYFLSLRNKFVIKFANYESLRHYTCLLFGIFLTWDEKYPVLCLGNTVTIFALAFPRG